MSTLTMTQRRADFEAMLKRAVRVKANMEKHKGSLNDAPIPGEQISALTLKVGELCGFITKAAWSQIDGSVNERRTQEIVMASLVVAAKCLQGLNGTGWTTPEALNYIIEDCAVFGWNFADENLNHLDLATDTNVRVQNLIVSLGYVADWWPIKVSTTNWDALMEQQTSLGHLAFEAICAALAAERGLWQEE
jgi:hypothetical protein|nr:MAG TPA: hypothetical protein [Caudoviricetes sp.]